MRLTIITVDGSTIVIKKFDQATLMPMLAASAEAGQAWLQFELDNNTFTWINPRNICRIDVDVE